MNLVKDLHHEKRAAAPNARVERGLKRRIGTTTEWVFDKDGKVLTEEECKAMSHGDLLKVALGRWVSNTPLFAVQLYTNALMAVVGPMLKQTQINPR